MIGFVVRRVAVMVVMLLVISFVVFFLAQLLPGDLARTVLGPQATPEQYAHLNAELGLDRPAIVRYFGWLGGVLHGDWGRSLLTGEPVAELVSSRLAASAALAGLALCILVPFSLGAGILSGLRENGLFDKTVQVVGSVLLILPEFVSGIILILVFGVILRVLPTTANAPVGTSPGEMIGYLILPALVVSFSVFGYLARMSRMETLEVLDKPYVRTAALKGLRRSTVTRRHIVRNALPTSLSITFLQAGFIFSGLIVVEQLFSYPGMGKLLLSAAQSHDVTVLQGSALAVAAIILTASLLGEITHAVLDPRARKAAIA